MLITSRDALRSLQRESGRQADFFLNRSEALSEFWGELEGEVTIALKENKAVQLLLVNGRDSISPIPIKACEQGQQPHNNNVIMALQ